MLEIFFLTYMIPSVISVFFTEHLICLYLKFVSSLHTTSNAVMNSYHAQCCYEFDEVSQNNPYAMT